MRELPVELGDARRLGVRREAPTVGGLLEDLQRLVMEVEDPRTFLGCDVAGERLAAAAQRFEGSLIRAAQAATSATTLSTLPSSRGEYW